MNTKPTQKDMIREHLLRKGHITQREADHLYGIMRLASRISELKKDGFPVASRRKYVGTRYWGKVPVAEYYYDTTK